MKVPILTYHAMNVAGNDYSDNDHVALADDLRLIARLGRRIVPLTRVVEALLGEVPQAEMDDAVAISCDDGSWFDWHDLVHPTLGPQRGFASILRDHAGASGEPVHATAFVIVSPAARAELDVSCMIGAGWWGDAWWPAAAHEGVLAIESHSWDHNHATLARTAQRAQRKGTFANIDTWAEADAEIRQASDWLDAHCGTRTSLFAFPYGDTSDYLVRDYLPRHAHEHRLRAAFTTSPAPVQRGADRWALPRYVCGRDWRSPDDLARLLRDAA